MAGTRRTLALVTLICGIVSFTGCNAGVYSSHHFETMPYDGFFNNLAHHDWGAADRPLTRTMLAAYSDGVYQPSGDDRPNPREISEAVMKGWTGEGSYVNRTALLVFFGQQVVEEILDAQGSGCPPEYFNIKIPKNDPDFDPEGKGNVEIPFLRGRYDQSIGYSPNAPREQMNEITPWIDGGLVYGISKAWTDALRSFEGGKLKASPDGRFPARNDIGLPMANPPPPRDHYYKDAKRFYMLGNPRGNENPLLLTFGVLLFRWHNLLAERIQKEHPDWKDEQIFLTARKWVVGTYQKIVVYDWLPSWLNDTLPDYSGYQSALHPGITHEFQSAAMRFGHTLVPPGVYRRNAQCEFRNTSLLTGASGYHGLRICNTYWNPQESIEESDIDEFLMGMASQIAEREDNIITPDLRGKVFGPLDFSRRDLMALNIQRGRDHGLPNYNTARNHYGLPEIKDWKEINPFLYDLDPALFDRLSDVHDGNISRVDIWTGGLLETTPQGPGPLFRSIIMNQFLRIRDADRFWFEYEKNGLFTAEELKVIWDTTLYDIIINVTNITPGDIQKDVFHHYADDLCPQPKQLNESDMEQCTDVQGFDYFDHSEWYFIGSFTAVGLLTLIVIFATWLTCAAMKSFKKGIMQRMNSNKVHPQNLRYSSLENNRIQAVEWRGSEKKRKVEIKIGPQNFLHVYDKMGSEVRVLNFDNILEVTLKLSSDNDQQLLLIHSDKEYDLVLMFVDVEKRDDFVNQLCSTLENSGVGFIREYLTHRNIIRHAYTHQKRKKKLEKFFKVIFAKVCRESIDSTDLESDPKTREILDCELTLSEFADSLSMKSDNDFIQQMFELADKDKNGYISFKEFLQLIIVLYQGSPEDKCRLIFNLYDTNGSGLLSMDQFKRLIKGTLELIQANIEQENMNEMVTMMYNRAGLSHENKLTFEDFLTVLGDDKENFAKASIQVKGLDNDMVSPRQVKVSGIERQNTCIMRPVHRTTSMTHQREASLPISDPEENKYPTTWIGKKWKSFVRYMENHRLHVFCLVMYLFFVVIGIFIERAYYFSIEREHAGLRMIAGYGVTVTRGAASVIMFTMSITLLTMCRNTITHLRSTFLNKYIPFDAAVGFHKIIAATLLLFTCVHIVGHSINFYHISTQTPPDLLCLFRDFFRRSHILPKFQYWLFMTTTGITGVLLTINMIIIYTFAMPYMRRHVYNAFWFSHKLYIPLYILTILHGSGRLVQPPLFQNFLLGPVILFALDKIVSVSRKKEMITVTKAAILPSGVTYLEWKRPVDFNYKSGQWLQISCIDLGENEYHPFTLTSSPNENTLSIHIRTVGPWTMNMQRKFHPDSILNGKYPKMYMDGPFGEGHQDWSQNEFLVLIGAGIGVTPFASILKDLVHQSQTSSQFKCKKVFFLWITRTQHQFEWLMDILREVEQEDHNNIIDVHIFITQFYQKFDLRTTMLYICERHFQTIAKKSLFTGLQAITHFGRPEFHSLLGSISDSLMQEHQVEKIGVFSCGPPSVTNSVQQACTELNLQDKALFAHCSENF